jgi:hypothetical protein
MLFINTFNLSSKFDQVYLENRVRRFITDGDYKSGQKLIMGAKLFKLKNFDYLDLFHKLVANDKSSLAI